MENTKNNLIEEINLSTNKDKRTVIKRTMNPILRFLMLCFGSVALGVLLAVFVIKPLLTKYSSSSNSKDAVYQISSDRKLEDRMIFYNNDNIIIVTNPIKINPSDSKGETILTTSIGFEFSSSSNIILNRFLNNELMVRDKIIELVSHYSSSQLLSPDVKISLMEQIKRESSLVLNTDKLSQLYFYDYYLTN
jgi:flagellar basal body-associated protein FliL